MRLHLQWLWCLCCQMIRLRWTGVWSGRKKPHPQWLVSVEWFQRLYQQEAQWKDRLIWENENGVYIKLYLYYYYFFQINNYWWVYIGARLRGLAGLSVTLANGSSLIFFDQSWCYNYEVDLIVYLTLTYVYEALQCFLNVCEKTPRTSCLLVQTS